MKHLRIQLKLVIIILAIFTLDSCQTDLEQIKPESKVREIYAEVVALDQPLTYNRFGSFNPYGMIYALKRDVLDCGKSGTVCKPMDEHTKPGHVRLRDDKRPRPLTLRVSEGDRLVIKFYNMLMPYQPDTSSKETQKRLPTAPPATVNKIDLHYKNLELTEIEPQTLPAEQEAFVPELIGAAGDPEILGNQAAKKYCSWEQVKASGQTKNPTVNRQTDWPRTRCASITISGIAPINGNDPKQTGLMGIPPGASIVYKWKIKEPEKSGKYNTRKSTHLFFSNSAPAGGEGDGGSLTHGLFGAVNIEPAQSQWYRSQVDQAVWNKIWTVNAGKYLDYEAVLDNNKTPALNMLRSIGDNRYELIYGDLNAIIKENPIEVDQFNPRKLPAFREFTVVFHDELKTFYADEFKELDNEFTLAGIGDGFGINYGASGMGSILLANRKKMGPSKDCIECAYEEFFLESWVNGDPALLPRYHDDPSNVHHSYLNDRVVFRNLHAGPKETHVFHLHAHQWLSQDKDTGTYLDSQTIAPQQGFSYEIYYGGSGNRNSTPGDSIFHCHLYPHFAQGMWELWRVHDVLEDGSRRLPDGLLGKGTDPLTGITQVNSGTPIPALIPLPNQAMLPEPSYLNDDKDDGEFDGFNGYPFYIAGEIGHRTPQAPYDIHKEGGLGRHVIFGNKGEREVSGLTPEQQKNMKPEEILEYALSRGDFTAKIIKANIRILPKEGTRLEQKAMDYHSQGIISSSTPEGETKELHLNKSPAKPGAPFADPCVGWTFDNDTFGQRTRQYHVSAIEMDMIVNKAGWHDPQARINVLDEDVPRFEGQSNAEAKPFFFRANSGDCIEFYHTNRTPEHLELDDFQVKTPTDTIGQHIHLVKFDVTASDGSGNGFNYEDGTFAHGAIVERIEATHALGGSAEDVNKNKIQLKTPPANTFQTTVQRWYADPLLADTEKCRKLSKKKEDKWKEQDVCYDRTIRTVFTHDHFAPSSIQQHGFYAALLIEPRDAEFQYPDGTNMDIANDKTNCKPGDLTDKNGNPVENLKSCAVGTQAMIIVDESGNKIDQNYREFALAIADFALLYDGNNKHVPGLKDFHKLPANKKAKLTELHNQLTLVQQKEGHPIDPPRMPEAISKDHHNPYLVNYRHEPIPLRIGCKEFDQGDGSKPLCSSTSIKKQLPGDKGDMAYVFDTGKHADPFTEIFAGYEGEKVQLRVIQGAQEVQHSLNINGLRWPREISDINNPVYVNAQEIGISEHFEMQLGFKNIILGQDSADYLYNFGSVDDLWNGAWGFLRTYSASNQDILGSLATKKRQLKDYNCNQQSKKIGDCIKPLIDNSERDENNKIQLSNHDQYEEHQTCPKESPKITFFVDAVDVNHWLGTDNLNYSNPEDPSNWNIADPNPLAYILLGSVRQANLVSTDEEDEKYELIDSQLAKIRQGLKQLYAKGKRLEPMVLRANAGDCIEVQFSNQLPKIMGDKVGDALMPKIVPLNVEQSKGLNNDVKPSNRASIHPQLVHYNIQFSDSAYIGRNRPADQGIELVPAPGESVSYFWYAGTVEVEGKELKHQAREFGAINLVSYADIINHPVHGLFGALIIEPEGATYFDPELNTSLDGRVELAVDDSSITISQAVLNNGGIRAEIRYPQYAVNHKFKEFVVFYRDGMNLHFKDEKGNSQPIPDCRICDDSYDLGEKGINYSTAPFWARLDQLPKQRPVEKGEPIDNQWFLPNLNAAFFPTEFFLEKYKPISTPTFTAIEDDEVRFRVLQPSGRARQRTFLVYGHDFPDMLPGFGSPHAPLISVGKGVTAKIDKAKLGEWLYRDGPTQMWSGGAWGSFKVNKKTKE